MSESTAGEEGKSGAAKVMSVATKAAVATGKIAAGALIGIGKSAGSLILDLALEALVGAHDGGRQAAKDKLLAGKSKPQSGKR